VYLQKYFYKNDNFILMVYKRIKTQNLQIYGEQIWIFLLVFEKNISN